MASIFARRHLFCCSRYSTVSCCLFLFLDSPIKGLSIPSLLKFFFFLVLFFAAMRFLLLIWRCCAALRGTQLPRPLSSFCLLAKERQLSLRYVGIAVSERSTSHLSSFHKSPLDVDLLLVPSCLLFARCFLALFWPFLLRAPPWALDEQLAHTHRSSSSIRPDHRGKVKDPRT